MKKKNKEKAQLTRKSKVYGGCLSVVKTILFLFLGLAPLTALTGFVEEIASDNTSIVEVKSTSSNGLPTTSELFDSLPKEVLDGVNAYNNNVLGFFGSMFGLDNFVFDQLTKVEVDNEPIVLRKDALDYINLYNGCVEISRIIENPSGKSLKNLNWDKLDLLVNDIFESGLIKGVVSNLLGDVINNYESFELGDYTEIFKAYKTSLQEKNVKEYFVHDLKQFYSSISLAGREGILDVVLLDNSIETTEKIDNILTFEYKTSVTTITDNLLEMNLVKDGFSPILDLVISTVDPEVFEFNTPDTTVENWDSFKTNVKSVVEEVVDLNTLISFTELISNPAEILDSSEDEIDALLTEAGQLLEKANNIGVLTDKDGNEIVDRFFINFDLPNILNIQKEPGNSSEFTIDGYDDLLNYLKKPIKNIVSVDIYDDLQKENNFKVICDKLATKLANDVKTDNGQKVYSALISDTILSLYRSDAFREKFMEPVLELGSEIDFVNLNELEVYESDVYNFDKSYNSWKLDLKYITALFTELKLIKIGSGETERTLFDAIIKNEEEFSEVLKQVSHEKISEVSLPIFYAKSLNTLVEYIFDTVETNLRNLTEDNTITLDHSIATFEEGNPEDQAVEITKILTKIIEYMPESGEYTSIEDFEYHELGTLLNLVKENAYRTILSGKSEEGLLKDSFIKFCDKLYEMYPDSKNIIGDKNLYEIDFVELVSIVEDIENAKDGSFIATLADLIEKENTTVEDLTALSDKITSDTDNLEKEEINELLDKVLDFGINLEVPGEGAEKEENTEKVLDTLDNNQNIDEELKNKIKDILSIA